jgi:hypothetical protein
MMIVLTMAITMMIVLTMIITITIESISPCPELVPRCKSQRTRFKANAQRLLAWTPADAGVTG